MIVSPHSILDWRFNGVKRDAYCVMRVAFARFTSSRFTPLTIDH